MASILSRPQWVNTKNFHTSWMTWEIFLGLEESKHSLIGINHGQVLVLIHQYSYLCQNQVLVLIHITNTHTCTRKSGTRSGPGPWEIWMLDKVIFKIILVIDGSSISFIAIRWMSLVLTGVKWTLVQVMVWCRQATSHYLSQSWLRSMLPYGITRPQWVKHLVTI